MTTKVTWSEGSSRNVALRLMSQYGTFSDALFELVDNPVDYRRGRHVEIEVSVDRTGDLIVVQDTGGEGMDAEGIADWLNWGSGHPHTATDIGRFHVGGKAAAGCLGKSVTIYARRAGTDEFWKFDDPEWGTREDWGNYGTAAPVSADEIPPALLTLPSRVGFTRFEIRNLTPRKRYRREELRFRLASTYRVLLDRRDITITLDGEPVRALELPESTAFKPVHVDEMLPSGHRLRGRIWRLDRDALVGLRDLGGTVRGGIRCLYNGRLVREQEWFGYNAEGKGLLASLIGEIELGFVPPTNNKTDFDRDSVEWEEVENRMATVLRPIIQEFRNASSGRASREERKLAAKVTRTLRKVIFDTLAKPSDGSAGEDGRAPASAGRKPPTGQGTNAPDAENGTGTAPTSDHPRRRPPRPRTPPPPDPVGMLRRLVDDPRRGRRDIPPVRIEPLERTLRSGRSADGAIIVNNEHFMYQSLGGAEEYLAETAILELLRPEDASEDESGATGAEDYYQQALHLLNRYIASTESAGD